MVERWIMTKMHKKLIEQINNHDSFIILAHKSIDLDAFGSALCMYQLIESYQKEVYILMANNIKNLSIEKSMNLLKENDIQIEYMTKDKMKIKGKNTLVIILDTNKLELLEYPNIIEQYRDIVLIDHHIESERTLSNLLIKYINPKVSSTAEIMTELIKYQNITIAKEIATILLAGLTVDTNNFNVKTSHKTFSAASYLITLGADNIQKQLLLKEDKESYIVRQDFVKNSNMINDHMALCIMDHKIYQNHELALIAEDLLQFDNVEASFTVGFIGKKQIGISARSVGKIDVEKFMRSLGGGGHKTDAACTIKSNSLHKVVKKLLKQIKNEVKK